MQLLEAWLIAVTVLESGKGAAVCSKKLFLSGIQTLSFSTQTRQFSVATGRK
jgi:hypothetical protein